MDTLQDKGGDVLISGGFASHGKGGNLQMRSGFSEATTSGDISLSTAASGSEGASGLINIFTGSTTNGDSGHLSLQTGNAFSPDQSSYYLQKVSPSAKSGDIHLKVGTGSKGDGGNIELWSGSTFGNVGSNGIPLDATGGNITMLSGFSVLGHSGSLDLKTADAGSRGSSGKIQLQNGKAAEGPAGMMSLSGGNSGTSEGSSIQIAAGVSAYYEKSHFVNGPDVSIHAGPTYAMKSRGGKVLIFGGAGLNEDRLDGGNGGSIELTGGYALGKNIEDSGGDILLQGGSSDYSSGGKVNITSGYSRRTSSGDLYLASGVSGPRGVSGKGKKTSSIQLLIAITFFIHCTDSYIHYCFNISSGDQHRIIHRWEVW